MKTQRRLENLSFFVVFLLPLYLVRIEFFFLRTNLWELMAIATIFFWIWQGYSRKNIARAYSEYKRYFWSAGIMFLGLFLSAFSHAQLFQSLGIIKGWFLIPLSFALVIGVILPKEKIKTVFWVYGLSSLTVAILSIVYLFLGKVTYDGRLQAFFNSPNYLAMYLAPGAIIFFMGFLNQFERKKSGNKHKKIFSSLGLLIILLALYKTYSYAAFAALTSSLLLLLVLRKNISIKKIAIFLAIITLIIFLQKDNDKFQSLIIGDSRSSFSSRQIIWQSSWKMVENNYMLGIGAANFQKTYLDYQRFFPPYLEWAVPHPQNLYLSFWLSGGILGLIGVSGLIVLFFRDIWRKKSQNVMGVLAISIMAYILFHGLFDTTYFKNDLAVVFWLNFVALKR